MSDSTENGDRRKRRPVPPGREPRWLPFAHFGSVGAPLPDPEDGEEEDPDDEERDTPPDVIAMLGFDPATYSEGDE